MFRRFGVSQFIFVCFSTLGLAACGGGGGGSATTSSSTTPTAFTSWLNITHPSVVSVDAIGYEGTYSYQTSSPYALTSVGSASEIASSSTVKLTYNSSGSLTKSVITTGSQTQTYDSFQTANSYLSWGLKTGDSNDWSLGADPLASGLQWRYNSFAIWTDPDSGSGKYGAISGGSKTSGASIPTTGSYTFTGVGTGFHVDSSNDIHFAQSNISATANFASRSVSVTASNTGKQQYLTSTGNFSSSYVSDANLNYTGTLSYSAATNVLSGTFTTTGGHTGSAIGRFYGPEGNELGGAFNLTGGGETYVGAFGAK